MIALLIIPKILQIGTPVASFTKEVNPRLAKRPLKTNGRLANRGLTSFVKESTGGHSHVFDEFNL